MRSLPFCSESFDVVVNLFTSFGYFDSDEQHLAVLKEVARTLVPGGWFVLDYFNASLIRKNLVGYEIVDIGGKRVEVKRRISDDGDFVIKNMTLLEEGGSYLERVRLFEPQQLQRFLGKSGFHVKNIFGGYDGEPLDAHSPRALIFSVRR
jgi:SAM-dependent methyltransferase